MHLIPYFLILTALLGHVVLCVSVLNRAHALAMPRRLLKTLDKPHLAILAGVPMFVVWHLASDPHAPARWAGLMSAHGWLAAYVGLCWLAAATGTLLWIRRRLIARPSAALVSNHTTVVDVAREIGQKPLGHALTKCLDLLPRHEMYQLHVHEKTIDHPRLPQRLDGLSIVHLSDLHLSGGITRPFFEYVVDRANQLDPDIVALTGDIIDTPRCLDWLPHTVGRLKSRFGAYFILGNHDRRLPDVAGLRSALTDVGLIGLGGRWQMIDGLGEDVLIAGNEWPWFGPRPDPPSVSGNKTKDFRILLSHSPDQIRWARRHQFDLMLAGHTHGGQIRLPIIGPILAPSLHGVKYASGVFDEPPTLMHVSRGISSLEPIRFNCPPELTKLVLKAAV